METIHEICDLSSPEPKSSPLKIRWAPKGKGDSLPSMFEGRTVPFRESSVITSTIFACCWNVCILHDPRISISTSTSFFFGACQRKLENQRFCKADHETSRLETRANRTRRVRHGRLFRRFWFECFFWWNLGHLGPLGWKTGMVPCPNPPSQAPCPPELELASEISGPGFLRERWILFPTFSDFVILCVSCLRGFRF